VFLKYNFTILTKIIFSKHYFKWSVYGMYST